jgi:hypothetical protein
MAPRTRSLSGKQQSQDGYETKEQRKARIAANRQAHEVANKYVLPVLALLALGFVAAMFAVFGMGHKKA